jgi:integrase
MSVIHPPVLAVGDDGAGARSEDHMKPITFPKLTLPDPGSRVAPTLGHPLIDHYLESVHARLRPNSTLAVVYGHLRLSMLRVVFERLIEWDHPDTPARNPIMWTDLPKLDEPLPKFLDDDQAARFMAAAVGLDPQRRLVVEMLARTGLRVTEFCELTDDAIVTLNETNWLRVPVGKLHTDRYVPLHPSLIDLHRDWLDWNGPNTTGRLISNKGRPLNRTSVSRIVKRYAIIAGIGHVHPHQLRHTLATQFQQRHEPRSRLRDVGAPIDAHDPRCASQTAPSPTNTSPPPTKSASSTQRT